MLGLQLPTGIHPACSLSWRCYAWKKALIEGHLDKVDRFALGVFLFQLYARARVSDIRSIARIVLDIAGGAGYIEVQTYEHKTKRITNTANIALLLIAPVKGTGHQAMGDFLSSAQLRMLGSTFMWACEAPFCLVLHVTIVGPVTRLGLLKQHAG